MSLTQSNRQIEAPGILPSNSFHHADTVKIHLFPLYYLLLLSEGNRHVLILLSLYDNFKNTLNTKDFSR